MGGMFMGESIIKLIAALLESFTCYRGGISTISLTPLSVPPPNPEGKPMIYFNEEDEQYYGYSKGSWRIL